VDLPAFEMPLLQSTDPDITPTRLDIDARALDRALASPSLIDEIEADDILEVVQAAPAPPKPARTLPPPPPSQPARSVPPPPSRGLLASIDLVLEEPDPAPLPSPFPLSFAPVSVEERSPWLEESTFQVAPAPGSRGRKAGLAWAVGLGLIAGIAVLCIALGSAGAKTGAQASAPAPEKESVVATTRPPSPPPMEARGSHEGSSAPTFDVASLPRAPVGTVSLAATASQHRLIVDGVLAPSGSAVVKCGKHVVKVGSRGRRQVVDVACGGETVVGL
jgi:hypothetical protein